MPSFQTYTTHGQEQKQNKMILFSCIFAFSDEQKPSIGTFVQRSNLYTTFRTKKRHDSILAVSKPRIIRFQNYPVTILKTNVFSFA